MLRHPSLQPLSRQHHHALALCVFIRRELEKATPDIGGMASRAARQFEDDIRAHFDAEERILFPAVAAELGAVPLVEQLLEEHRQLQSLAAALKEAPGAAALADFAELLRRHVRTEENELFELIQARFGAEALARLGEALASAAGPACGLKGND